MKVTILQALAAVLSPGIKDNIKQKARTSTYMEYEVEGARPRSRQKKTWTEVVQTECQARKLNKEDAIDHIRWMKQIRDE